MDAGDTCGHAGKAYFRAFRRGVRFEKASGTQAAEHRIRFCGVAARFVKIDIEIPFNVFAIE